MPLAAPHTGCQLQPVVSPNAERTVTLLRGESARRKTVQLETPPAAVAQWLERQLAPPWPPAEG